MKPLPDDWENAIRHDLRQAMPAVPVPPDVQERIRQRLHRAQIAQASGRLSTETPTMAPVVQLPSRAKPRRRWWRWTAVAAIAALLLESGGPQVGRFQRRWFGPQASFPIAAPFTLSGAAAAGTPTTPGLMQNDAGVTFELAAPLPELPQRGQIQRAETPFDPAWVEQVKTKLGIAEPVTRDWDKVPVLTPLIAYRAGRLSLAKSGAWGFQPDGPRAVQASSAPPPEPPLGPVISDEEAVKVASDWLNKAGLYPAGDVTIRVYRTPKRADQSLVEITPAKGTPLAAAGDLPYVRVTLRSREVRDAYGIWPTGTAPAGEVPLRTAQEAWADLQAGIGAVVGTTDPFEDSPAIPKMTIRSVSLDRALVRSLEDRWYYIPVVLFEGEIKDAQGKGHKALAYVSAVKPTPGQGGFELKTSLPEAHGAAPFIQVHRPEKHQPWTPAKPIETFHTPTPEHVRQAALRVAEATGADPKAVGTPDLHWSPGEVTAIVSATWNGLPALQTMGDPQWLSAVWTSFYLNGSLRYVTLLDVSAEPVGAPVDLISPEEAWQQVQAGAGMVKEIRDGRTFPTAHFAAHRTTIDRVELAYNVDVPAWRDGKPAEPTYFFWGKSVVGEDYTEYDVVVMVSAVRRQK